MSDTRKRKDDPDLDLFVVFDGPPAPESGRFVEVEDRRGVSQGPSTVQWSQRKDGLWQLGPFRAVDE